MLRVRAALLTVGLSSLVACLGPVSEEPLGEKVPLPDGGFELICGDGGTYGLGYERLPFSVKRRDGGAPVFSESCARIRGNLNLWGEVDFKPYRNVQVVEGGLFLGDYNPSTTPDLAPLGNLRSVQRLSVQRTRGRLSSLNGLNLEGILGGGLEVFGSDGLSSLSALKPTLIRGGDMTISSTDSLESLDGLQGVTHLKSLEITDNKVLRDLSGLSNLKRVEGDVTIQGNPELRGADEFLKGIEVGGQIYR